MVAYPPENQSRRWCLLHISLPFVSYLLSVGAQAVSIGTRKRPSPFARGRLLGLGFDDSRFGYYAHHTHAL